MILEDPRGIERWRQAGWHGTTTIDNLFRKLVAYVVDKGVARFMLPERLEIVAALPRNLARKPLKRELTAALLARNVMREIR